MAKAKGKASIGQVVRIVAQQPLPENGGPLQGEPEAAATVAYVDGNTINAYVYMPKGPLALCGRFSHRMRLVRVYFAAKAG